RLADDADRLALVRLERDVLENRLRERQRHVLELHDLRVLPPLAVLGVSIAFELAANRLTDRRRLAVLLRNRAAIALRRSTVFAALGLRHCRAATAEAA